MESEAMFVFVVYEPENLPDRYGVALNDASIRETKITIKRASMQKPVGRNEHSKRLHVDFDPLTVPMCHLVAGFYRLDQGSLITTGIFKPIAAFELEEEANEFRKNVEETGGKQFSEKKEKLDKVITYPLIITKQ